MDNGCICNVGGALLVCSIENTVGPCSSFYIWWLSLKGKGIQFALSNLRRLLYFGMCRKHLDHHPVMYHQVWFLPGQKFICIICTQMIWGSLPQEIMCFCLQVLTRIFKELNLTMIQTIPLWVFLLFLFFFQIIEDNCATNFDHYYLGF